MKDYLFAIFGFITCTVIAGFGAVLIYEDFGKIEALPWFVLMIVIPMLLMLYVAYFVGLVMACWFLVSAIKDWLK